MAVKTSTAGGGKARAWPVLAMALTLAPATAWTAAGERLRRADADHDGFLSRAEAQRASPRLAQQFDAIDSDRDGRLSPQEIRNFGRGKGGARTRAQGADQAGSPLASRFAAADRDGDGLLSRSEAESALPRVARKFDRMDANGDGGISLGELRAWLERRKRARSAKS